LSSSINVVPDGTVMSRTAGAAGFAARTGAGFGADTGFAGSGVTAAEDSGADAAGASTTAGADDSTGAPHAAALKLATASAHAHFIHTLLMMQPAAALQMRARRFAELLRTPRGPSGVIGAGQ
jgi:hypothetical protein